MVQLFARVARPYFVLLAIFTVPYEKGTWYFSIVQLTILASIFSTAYTRRWLGWGLGRAAAFAAFLALSSQVVILLSTAASYLFGVPSYFNHPTALNRPAVVDFGQALGIRLGGLVVNSLVNGIGGALGWALGGLLPGQTARH
jgi:hypothetical protein